MVWRQKVRGRPALEWGITISEITTMLFQLHSLWPCPWSLPWTVASSTEWSWLVCSVPPCTQRYHALRVLPFPFLPSHTALSLWKPLLAGVVYPRHFLRPQGYATTPSSCPSTGWWSRGMSKFAWNKPSPPTLMWGPLQAQLLMMLEVQCANTSHL